MQKLLPDIRSILFTPQNPTTSDLVWEWKNTDDSLTWSAEFINLSLSVLFVKLLKIDF